MSIFILPMYYLIYLVLGKNSDCRSEMIYSLLSYDEMAGSWSKKNIRILVYTDDVLVLPECLQHLPVTVNLLQEEYITGWIKKGHGHFFILKAAIMHDFLEQYNATGILIDTDTFFMKDPGHLFKTIDRGHLLMHLEEYPISNRSSLNAFFRRKKFRQLNGDDHIIDPSFMMWNSGIVGVTPDYKELLNEIIYLIEQISFQQDWPKDEQRLIEQTSFSYYLQKQKRTLLPAEEYVMHYWFFKWWRYMLALHFNFFYDNDFTQYNQLLTQLDIQKNIFDKISYKRMPYITVNLMKQFALLRDFHFECLPSGTYMGNILRSSFDINTR